MNGLRDGAKSPTNLAQNETKQSPCNNVISEIISFVGDAVDNFKM